MSARTIMAAPVIWFGSWLLSLMTSFLGWLRLRRPWRGGSWSWFLGNKKGPRRGPCAPPDCGWHLAIPGDAPGYYDDNKLGNNISHSTAQASQRLRDHTAKAPKVKPPATN